MLIYRILSTTLAAILLASTMPCSLGRNRQFTGTFRQKAYSRHYAVPHRSDVNIKNHGLGQ